MSQLPKSSESFNLSFLLLWNYRNGDLIPNFKGMFIGSINLFNIHLSETDDGFVYNSMLESVLAELCYVLSSSGEDWPPKMRGRTVYVKTSLLVQRCSSNVLLFLPCLWSTKQFRFFFFLLTGVLRCFIGSHWYWSRTKKRVPGKKFDLVDTQETLNCNILITLFIPLLVSNIQAQDDKQWGERD